MFLIGSSDLLLDFGRITSNLPLLELFTLYSSSFRRTDTTVPRGELNRGFTVSEEMNFFKNFLSWINLL